MTLNNILKKYVRNSNFVHRKIGADNILVPIRQINAESESLYTLNDVASFIWEQLKDPKNIEELLETILIEYEVNKDTARQDVMELVNNLVENGILVEE